MMTTPAPPLCHPREGGVVQWVTACLRFPNTKFPSAKTFAADMLLRIRLPLHWPTATEIVAVVFDSLTSEQASGGEIDEKEALLDQARWGKEACDMYLLSRTGLAIDPY